MVNSCILLAELKAVCCTNIAEVLMLTFWEARHIKKGGKLMGVDMLLLDEKVMDMNHLCLLLKLCMKQPIQII
ncbi:hypothetical protein HID58_094057 [Brassica napus]|uniref:Uncharacterized protein n=1 Tax=Brassica napus TaxID=3708 RepID=A0ABQ7X9A0_BRANA|nr:hypothetical protein HID58_094057 [Brassica napus]